MRNDQAQQQHYELTAEAYDDDPGLGESPEHELALYLLLAVTDSVKAESLLDVGAGTGRAMRFLARHRPSLACLGVEPVDGLREVAHHKGVPVGSLIPATGYQLPFRDASFDIVTEFGVLHHVKRPEIVLREMLRVARYAVFLSDSNNLGMGRFEGRLIKNLCFGLGLWRTLNWARTRGRGYVFEPNDGLWYYYTVFQHFRELKRRCHSVHVINTRMTSRTPWFSASHVVVVATKPAIIARSPFFAHLK
jgi:ubiquinone/menaquinone biosynthesis C-methylase UbiE